MDIATMVFDAIVRGLPTAVIFYLIWRRLSWIKFRLEVIESLSQGAFLHSSNIDREIYYLRRRVCLEHYYPPQRLEVESR